MECYKNLRKTMDICVYTNTVSLCRMVKYHQGNFAVWTLQAVLKKADVLEKNVDCHVRRYKFEVRLCKISVCVNFRILLNLV